MNDVEIDIYEEILDLVSQVSNPVYNRVSEKFNLSDIYMKEVTSSVNFVLIAGWRSQVISEAS